MRACLLAARAAPGCTRCAQECAGEIHWTGASLTLSLQGKQSPVDVALLRSDYMADSVQNRLLQVPRQPRAQVFLLCRRGSPTGRPTPRCRRCPRQVETNTIAASFGGLSPLVTKLHCEMVRECSFLPALPPPSPVTGKSEF